MVRIRQHGMVENRSIGGGDKSECGQDSMKRPHLSRSVKQYGSRV